MNENFLHVVKVIIKIGFVFLCILIYPIGFFTLGRIYEKRKSNKVFEVKLTNEATISDSVNDNIESDRVVI